MAFVSSLPVCRQRQYPKAVSRQGSQILQPVWDLGPRRRLGRGASTSGCRGRYRSGSWQALGDSLAPRQGASLGPPPLFCGSAAMQPCRQRGRPVSGARFRRESGMAIRRGPDILGGPPAYRGPRGGLDGPSAAVCGAENGPVPVGGCARGGGCGRHRGPCRRRLPSGMEQMQPATSSHPARQAQAQQRERRRLRNLQGFGQQDSPEVAVLVVALAPIWISCKGRTPVAWNCHIQVRRPPPVPWSLTVPL